MKFATEKKKDYRLLCKLFFTASPSLLSQGYKASCNINKHNAPCRKCEKCKFGIRPF